MTCKYNVLAQVAFIMGYFLFALPFAASANNLMLSTPQLLSNSQIQCTVSWQHSWRQSANPNNYDGVWLFVKYRQPGQPWTQLLLSNQNSMHQAAAPLETKVAADGLGLMVQRSSTGSGSVQSLVTLYTQMPLPAGNIEIAVFGVEMVYIPDGPFYIGDSLSKGTFQQGNSRSAYFVNDEAAMTIGSGAGQLSDTILHAPAGTIPASFPKGHKGFYMMKYEISQWQYVDFLNTLTLNQQTGLTYASPMAAAGTPALSSALSNRSTIVVSMPSNGSQPAVYACNANNNGLFNEPDDGQNRACNFLDWNGLAAYLDWAGLRPFTELEFEKACRGPLYPVAGELAFGASGVTDANTITNDGTATETHSETYQNNKGICSHGYFGPQGPLRCGFAARSNTTRLQSGASYYGVMELSGNLWEMVVQTTDTEGLLFTGLHGDGQLSNTGSADVAFWPNFATAAGAGYRGGAWLSGVFNVGDFRDVAVSDRFYAGLRPTIRRNTSSGRGVRVL